MVRARTRVAAPGRCLCDLPSSHGMLGQDPAGYVIKLTPATQKQYFSKVRTVLQKEEKESSLATSCSERLSIHADNTWVVETVCLLLCQAK